MLFRSVVIAGATAVGGGEIILVVLSEFEVLLLVESVTIGSAAQTFVDIAITKSTALAIFLYICLPFVSYCVGAITKT